MKITVEMKMAPILQLVVFVSLTIFLGRVNGDYNCVCNYNVEIGVMKTPSALGEVIGDLYEFDCKEHIESMDTDQWLAVAYDHKIGYVQQDAQTQQQICPGEPPSEDKVTTTTLVTSSSTTTTIMTTVTIPTTNTPTTTASTTSPTTVLMTTESTTTPSTTSSTTTPTTTSSTTTPTTTSSTTTPSTTSSTTTPTTTSTTTTQSTTSPTTPTPTTTTRTTVITTPTTQSTTTPTTSSPTTSATASTKPTTMRTNVVSGKPKLCTAQLQSRVQNDRNILTQYDNSCYEIVSSGITSWFNADTHCKMYGGHLVSINSQGEQIFITNFLKHNFYHEVWTGLNDNSNENMFVWTSGEPVSLTNWNPNRVDPGPVMVGSDYQDCVVLSPSNNGLWDDRICQSTHNYICEYAINSPQTYTSPALTQQQTTLAPFNSGKPNLCPINLQNRINNAGTLLTQYGDLCYETVISSMQTWNQAEQYCNSNGGHLVTIDSAGKQTFITNYLKHDVRHTIWIGLTDSENEGHFEWASGKLYADAHWQTGLFSHFMDGSEDCAVMIVDYAGHWDDRICTATHYFMCEYRLDGISMVTTPAPTVHVTYATVDPSSLDVPGDLNRCPSTIRSKTNSDQGILGYYQNSCYELMPSRKVNYQRAEQLCTSRGGKLVDILSSHEQAFVQAFLERYSPQHAAWIGLHDMVNENLFEWMSGDPVSYTNWLPGHTSNFVSHSQEDCVVIIPYKNGQWDDIPCGHYGFLGESGEIHQPLCEYKLSGSSGNAFVG